MRLARLPLAALALIALAACSNDATGPEMARPSGPSMNGTYFGSGMKAADSLSTSTTAWVSATTTP